MIKLAVFDWNGTVLADLRAIVEGTNKELEFLGFSPITIEQYQACYDSPIARLYENLGIDPVTLKTNSEEAASVFHGCYEPLVAKARTRQGARQVIAALHAAGTTNIVLSNHTMEGIYLQLERLGLEPYFAEVLANEALNTVHFSSKEHRLVAYMERERVRPEDTIIIGDTVEEVRIARKLGLKVVCITGGYNSTRRLIDAKPDALIHNMNDLLKVMEEL